MVMKSKIEWCDYTLNPLIGCKHGCPYCYGKRMNERFKFVKKWDEPEVKDNWDIKLLKIKNPSIIFMGSLTDLFGDWVEDWVIQRILDWCSANQQHRFLFLTKRPHRYSKFDFPKNCLKGMTVESGSIIPNSVDFLSIEPLMNHTQLNSFSFVKWVICGGMTPKNCHNKEWVDELIEICKRKNTPLFLKDNLHYPKEIKQYPEELKWIRNQQELKRNGFLIVE